MVAAAALALVALAARTALAAGFQVDWDSASSIKDAAKTIAADTMAYYDGDQPGKTPGLLFDRPNPELWWWAGGVLAGTMIEYEHYTNDKTYNKQIQVATAHQAGVNQDFLTPNWTAHMGNDDQGFWGQTAMVAAECKFDDPPKDQPQWLATAQGVFNTMSTAESHETQCGGGLRWQVNLYSKGYNYKNSISNGLLFNIAARLARYTNNQTYHDYAIKMWDWERARGLMSDDYAVYDGAWITDGCQRYDPKEWTYNAGVFLHGAAFMYNQTDGSQLWRERTQGLLDHAIAKFFTKGIVSEACQNEKDNLCERDQYLFKGVLLRWMATVAQVAPFTREKIFPLLKSTAQAAVAQCTGGDNGRACGFQWTSGQFDGKPGVGTQISTLASVISALSTVTSAEAPVTEKTGGTSRGSAGAGVSREDGADRLTPITTASKVAATFLTMLVVVGIIGIQVWIVLD